MDIRLQRAIDRYVGVPARGVLSLIERLRGGSRGGVPPRRILVILLSELGSLVHARPMFERLRERYPAAEIYLLQFARNRGVTELLELVPADHVIAIDDRSLGRFLRDTRRALHRLRALDLDIAIDCELFARVGSLLAYMSGAPVRVGFHPHTQEGLYRGSFINRPVLYNPYRHVSEQFLTMADAIESGSRPLAKAAPASDPPVPVPCTLPPAEVAEAAANGCTGSTG